jgi:hypothetical protein
LQLPDLQYFVLLIRLLVRRIAGEVLGVGCCPA